MCQTQRNSEGAWYQQVSCYICRTRKPPAVSVMLLDTKGWLLLARLQLPAITVPASESSLVFYLFIFSVQTAWLLLMFACLSSVVEWLWCVGELSPIVSCICKGLFMLMVWLCVWCECSRRRGLRRPPCVCPHPSSPALPRTAPELSPSAQGSRARWSPKPER